MTQDNGEHIRAADRNLDFDTWSPEWAIMRDIHRFKIFTMGPTGIQMSVWAAAADLSH